jgi:MarR-like DNA-binding transcriptional regulator SgrR of sgrS sRNA
MGLFLNMKFKINHSSSVSIAIICILLGLTGILYPSLRAESFQTAQKEEEPVRSQGTWHTSVPVQRLNFDPSSVVTFSEKSLLLAVYSRLVRVNSKFQVEPDLLEKWSYSFDEQRYDFVLKENARFHSGSRVTSDDVEFSLEMWANRGSLDHDLLTAIEGVEDFASGAARRIKGFRKISPSRFSVYLSRPSQNFIFTLSSPRFIVIPHSFAGKRKEDFFAKPIGSGPFQIQTLGVSELKAVAHSEYHLGRPRLSELNVKAMRFESAIEDFRRGAIDDLLMHPVSNVDSLHLESGKAKSEKILDTKTLALMLSPLDPAFQSPVVRGKIKSLVNREQLADACYPGSLSAKSIIPRGLIGSPVGNVQVSNPVVDSDDANLITSMSLFVADDENASCLSSAFAKMFAEMPLEVKVDSMQNMFSRLLDGKLGFWVESLAFKNNDPMSVLQYFNQKSSEYFLHVPVPPLQDMFNRLEQSLSLDERAHRYREIDGFLVNSGFVIPLLQPATYLVYSKHLSGLSTSGSRDYVADWHLVKKENDL